MGRPLGSVLALLLTLVMAGCPDDVGFGAAPRPDPEDPDAVEDPYWCCDPDTPRCVCPSYWRCTDGWEGKVCRQSNPELPDAGGDGAWSCEYRDDLIVCTGRASEHPDAGADGGWNCVEDDETDMVTCDRAATEDDFPDEGDGIEWSCDYSSGAEARACSEADEEGEDDGGWDCMTGADGMTVCSNYEPQTPDDQEWQCYRREDGTDVCQGSNMPDGGSAQGWDCRQEAEVVICEKADGEVPDTPGDGPWDCTRNDVAVRCHDNPGGGGDVGGEGEGEGGGGDLPGGEGEGEGGEGGGGDLPGGEGEGEGEGDGGDGPGDDCECIAGAVRYCDEPAYCLWGQQECQEWFGQREWGPCEETFILPACAPGGALARDYAWHYEGGFWDSPQTRAFDFDGDGILVYPPDFWYNPAASDCAVRAGECVQDMWDLDGDGDNQESIGDCADIQQCV